MADKIDTNIIVVGEENIGKTSFINLVQFIDAKWKFYELPPFNKLKNEDIMNLKDIKFNLIILIFKIRITYETKAIFDFIKIAFQENMPIILFMLGTEFQEDKSLESWSVENIKTFNKYGMYLNDYTYGTCLISNNLNLDKLLIQKRKDTKIRTKNCISKNLLIYGKSIYISNISIINKFLNDYQNDKMKELEKDKSIASKLSFFDYFK
jgi:hypothetical protein